MPFTENELSGRNSSFMIGNRFLFARGTSESGNVGARIGPPLIADLRAVLGTAGIAAQGVDHDASVLGNPHPTSKPTTPMVSLINTAARQCPSTKIVISRYSQGTQVVHNAAAKLTAAVTARITAGGYPPLLPPSKRIEFSFIAVVVFGDPDRVARSTLGPSAPSPRPRSPSATPAVCLGLLVSLSPNIPNFVYKTDIICTGSGEAEQHLNYDLGAPAASAFFVVTHVWDGRKWGKISAGCFLYIKKLKGTKGPAVTFVLRSLKTVGVSGEVSRSDIERTKKEAGYTLNVCQCGRGAARINEHMATQRERATKEIDYHRRYRSNTASARQGTNPGVTLGRDRGGRDGQNTEAERGGEIQDQKAERGGRTRRQSAESERGGRACGYGLRSSKS
ncbi:cutinase-domain-containing protein [Mycena vulgaris]|nr:cutinase-domain-containing protein [Mycena vulgaris]